MGVHPALASSVAFRLGPSLEIARVGIPLAEDCSAVLVAGVGSIDELGDLGTSFRRPLVGVDGPATVEVEVTGGLLIRPLPVFTGVPEVIVDSPTRRIRRERGVAAAVEVVGPLSMSAFSSRDSSCI